MLMIIVIIMWGTPSFTFGWLQLTVLVAGLHLFGSRVCAHLIHMLMRNFMHRKSVSVTGHPSVLQPADKSREEDLKSQTE